VMIKSRDLAPGDPLPSERELMARFAVGRPAIREALQSLERMGLVEIRHGERARVAVPSFGRMVDQMSESVRHLLTHSSASLEHLKEARATFEMEMARIAARRRRPGDVKRLRSVVVTQATLIDDQPRFLEWDGKFHKEIASISGNPVFVSVSESLFGWLANFHIQLVRSPGQENLTIGEHHEIIAAIAEGNVDGAAIAMGDHLSRANRLYQRTGMDTSKKRSSRKRRAGHSESMDRDPGFNVLKP
jgi:GntR family transcriptional regulator, sialic acid-inducible nan operon repressor